MKTDEVSTEEYVGHRRVRKGFNWSAFFLTVLWTGKKGLWKETITGSVILLLFVSFIILSGYNWHCLLLVGLSLPVFCMTFGEYGNKWMRNKLKKKGFHRKY